MHLKYQPREEQKKILEFFKSAVAEGKKYILLDAPTGIGKSFAVLLMADAYQKDVDVEAKFDVITNSKILQTQYVTDFPEMASLWGRANYACAEFGNCEDGFEMCSIIGRPPCDGCPCTEAQNAYRNAEVSVTNFHLLCNYALHKPGAITDRNARILFVDEAHELEETFSDMISATICRETVTRFEFDQDVVERLVKRCDSLHDASDTMSEMISLAKDLLEALRRKYEEIKARATKLLSHKRKEAARKMTNIARACVSYEFFVESAEAKPTDWVLETEEVKSRDGRTTYNKYSAQPLWVGPLLEDMLWRHYDHVVFMSATILHRELFSFLNGLKVEETAYLALPSPFPKDNRKIVYKQLGRMSYKEKRDTWQLYAPFLSAMLSNHPGEKGMIHAGTYEVTSWLKRDVPSDRLIFHETKDRDLALERHCTSERPTVLVSPSMTHGIDLKDDLCRFQAILKMPYPNLSSNKVNRRLATMPLWYDWKTVCEIVQAYGRGVRNEEDWCVTYILDSNFGNIAAKRRDLFPKFFTEAFA